MDDLPLRCGGLMKTRLRLFLLISSVLVLAGCVKTGRLYNLSTSAVTQIKITYSGSGKGKILPVSIAGEQFTGEYVTVPTGTTGWGQIYSRANGTGGSATGQATVATTSLDTQQHGQVIATGDKGTVIQCEYIVSGVSGAGTGACEDNHGGKYRLMF
jgi:hypothetical protein